VSHLLALILVFLAAAAPADQAPSWLKASAAALGGEEKLRALTAIELDGVSTLYQREQSERPEGPWVATYSDFTDVRDFAADAVRRTARLRGYSTPDWVNNREWLAPGTTFTVSGVSLQKSNDRWVPARTPWEIATLPLAFEPERVVLTALDAADLHAEPDVQLHGYTHHVVAFSSGSTRMRILLNPPSLLPKAVEITRARPFDTFWAPWGDVTQRVTFGVWILEPEGIRFPRLWDFSTGGRPDGRVDITRVRMNAAVDPAGFSIPADVRQNFIANRRRIADIPFGSPQRPAVVLAPGIVKVPANWDITEVQQGDGVVILEGPLVSDYSAKVIADAGKRFGGAAIKAVVTTSDSWPHIGGMREYVARGVPIYALDLNVPILNRLFAATYRSFPDALARASKPARMHPISTKTTLGTGANRIELYPLRTVTGERQMLVYFPEHELLYTSDLFTIAGERIFLPQQVSEAVDAVNREHLSVKRAFGMHYDVLDWAKVVDSAKPPKY
jgi:hypothetical protein